MKIHAGKMLDRCVYPYTHLKVQEDNGRIVEVRVAEENRESAAAHWGGSYVSYTYRGGRAYYQPQTFGDRDE